MKSIDDIIVAHLNNEASAEEVQRLFEWVREKPSNAKEFARCSLLHAQLRGQFSGEKQAHESGGLAPVGQVLLPVKRRLRVPWKPVVLAIAVCLLIAAGAGVWWLSVGSQVGDDLIVLAPTEQGNANEPMVPFTFEASADVIAIAVMGQTLLRRGQQLIRMELVEVLKGGQQAGALESADGLVPFGCIMPKNPKRFSDMYREGERVAVYLTKSNSMESSSMKSKERWSTLQMFHLTEQYEPQWKARVQPFLDVWLASEADDPEQRYKQLLVSNESARKLNGAAASPQLTEAAYYALTFNPDPRAAGPVRDMLMASIGSGRLQQFNRRGADRKQPGQSDHLTPRVQANAKRAVVFPNAPLNYVTLLARMHDAESIVPVMAYISGFSEDKRYQFIQLLPELCRDADAEKLRMVQIELDKYIAAYRGDKDHYHYRNLEQVRARIGEFIVNQEYREAMQ